MKKILLVAMAFLSLTMSNAQTKKPVAKKPSTTATKKRPATIAKKPIVASSHFAFMKIPIDGNINSFTQKLAAKGIKVSPLNATNNPPNGRIFEGVWCGENTKMLVDYFGPNKTVYEVEVLIQGTSGTALELKKTDIEFDIVNKYAGRFDSRIVEREENQELTLYTIYTSSKKEEELGTISTYIDKTEYPYQLWFIYIDEKNHWKELNQKNDDI